MRYLDEGERLRVEVDAKEFVLSAEDARRLQNDLSRLGRLLEDLPTADLYVTIFQYPRGGPAYQVKTALVLPAKTLFSRTTDEQIHPALGRCITNLIEQVAAYKRARENADQVDKHRQGTYHDVVPIREPDGDELEAAVQSGDYVRFRKAMDPYEPSLRRRIGRWVGRFSDVQEKIGTELAIEDVKEAVFLNAFEGYEARPRRIRLGHWLEGLIDASVKGLLQNPAEELDNISFARTLRDLAREQSAAAREAAETD